MILAQSPCRLPSAHRAHNWERTFLLLTALLLTAVGCPSDNRHTSAGAAHSGVQLLLSNSFNESTSRQFFEQIATISRERHWPATATAMFAPGDLVEARATPLGVTSTGSLVAILHWVSQGMPGHDAYQILSLRSNGDCLASMTFSINNRFTRFYSPSYKFTATVATATADDDCVRIVGHLNGPRPGGEAEIHAIRAEDCVEFFLNLGPDMPESSIAYSEWSEQGLFRLEVRAGQIKVLRPTGN